MLSARAHTFRQKVRLAVSLSWIGGYTNVLSLLLCGQSVSHMTGNVTKLSESPVLGAAAPMVYLSFLVACFAVGAAAAGALLEMSRVVGFRTRYALPLAAETVLLTGFSIAVGFELHGSIGQIYSPALYAMTGMAAMAMGLQNATITRISGSVVRTTHLTGVTTDIGLEAAHLLTWSAGWLVARPRGCSVAKRAVRLARVVQRHPASDRLGVLAGIWGFFFFGGVMGTWVVYHLSALAMIPPVLFLAAIILLGIRRRVADVREVDDSDPELAGHGIRRDALPPQLGVFRMSDAQRGRTFSPNLLGWLEQAPRRWRVIVLGVSAGMPLGERVLRELATAAETLRSERRRLVLAGVTADQCRGLIASSRPRRSLDVADCCPDLEFAIARGMELVRSMAAAGSLRP